MPDIASDPEFTAALRESADRLGEIFRRDAQRQRRELQDRIRAMLRVARGRDGGELAAALLQVMVVVDRWRDEALVSSQRPVIGQAAAADEILTAIETGLGVRQP